MAAAPAGGGARVLSQAEQDIQMILAADVNLGTGNCDDFQMERYVYKRRTNGIYIIKLDKTREKLQFVGTGRVSDAFAVENTEDITVQSARPYGRRDALKFAQHVDARAHAAH